ncbi:MAG: EF-P 5-aminopentanol modification-associated protein YfmF [Oscillospiraceae bacterium]
MAFNHKKVELSKNVVFHTIIDKKFKSNVVSVKFIVPLESEFSALNSLAISTACSSNSKYKTIRELNRKLNGLYGSSISSDISKVGDIQILSVNVRFIDDRFTFDNENLTEEVVDIFLDCLFNPNVENNQFDEDMFNINKKELLDTIESEINNKRVYAIIQSKKTIYKDEPASVLSYGDKEHTLKATSKEAYEVYKNLLNTANIDIFYVGCTEKPIIEQKFRQAFSSLKDRNPYDMPISKPSIIKSQVEEVTQEMEVSQSKMVMALKTTYEDKYTNIIMNTILGNSPFSKLFSNVREKLSLCYYCQSSCDIQKRTILIDSGIEYSNFEKSKQAILQQIEDIKNGNFTDEDLINSKKYLCNSLKSVGDSASSYINWYLFNDILKTDRNVKNEYEKYSAVTREDIIKSANELCLDTIYLLKPKNS